MAFTFQVSFANFRRSPLSRRGVQVRPSLLPLRLSFAHIFGRACFRIANARLSVFSFANSRRSPLSRRGVQVLRLYTTAGDERRRTYRTVISGVSTPSLHHHHMPHFCGTAVGLSTGVSTPPPRATLSWHSGGSVDRRVHRPARRPGVLFFFLRGETRRHLHHYSFSCRQNLSYTAPALWPLLDRAGPSSHRSSYCSVAKDHFFCH